MSNDEEKAKRRGDGTVATNRKANHDFAIGETYTCGIELMGPEVKSLRLNTASIAEAFARVDENLELWLYGMHINQYKFSREVIDPIRPRRLLAHKKEIIQMSKALEEKGTSLICLKIIFYDGKAKALIGVGKGIKQYDKRQALKKKDQNREIEKVLKFKNR